jgi:hypothetical protein
LSLTAYLSRALNASNAASWGIAFEAFGAYLLARAFSEPTPLSDVFEFVGDKHKALRDEPAELATLEMVDDDFQTTTLQIKTNRWSNHVWPFSLNGRWHVRMAPEPTRIRFLLPFKPRWSTCNTLLSHISI